VSRFTIRPVLALLGVAVAALALTAAASADQTFHTLHADLTPVGGAPLQSGFVNDIHINGNKNAAHERYQLNGAAPGATYQVSIELWPLDPSCTGAPPLAFPTSQLTTNGAGNGEAGFEFPVGPPTGLEGVESGIAWTVSLGGVVQYETGCNTLTLD